MLTKTEIIKTIQDSKFVNSPLGKFAVGIVVLLLILAIIATPLVAISWKQLQLGTEACKSKAVKVDGVWKESSKAWTKSGERFIVHQELSDFCKEVIEKEELKQKEREP